MRLSSQKKRTMKNSFVLSALIIAIAVSASFEPIRGSDVAYFKSLVRKDKEYSQICDLYYTVQLAKEVDVAIPKMVPCSQNGILMCLDVRHDSG